MAHWIKAVVVTPVMVSEFDPQDPDDGRKGNKRINLYKNYKELNLPLTSACMPWNVHAHTHLHIKNIVLLKSPEKNWWIILLNISAQQRWYLS